MVVVQAIEAPEFLGGAGINLEAEVAKGDVYEFFLLHGHVLANLRYAFTCMRSYIVYECTHSDQKCSTNGRLAYLLVVSAADSSSRDREHWCQLKRAIGASCNSFVLLLSRRVAARFFGRSFSLSFLGPTSGR